MIVFPLFFSAGHPQLVEAQGKDGIKIERNIETGKVSFITSESGRPVVASQAIGVNPGFRPSDPAMALAQRYAPQFGVRNPTSELSVLRKDHGEDGKITVRYQQKYPAQSVECLALHRKALL